MSFQFSGIFGRGGQKLLNEVLGECEGFGRAFTTPFEGIGIAFVGEHDFCDPLEPSDLSLIEWSTRDPEQTFVYLWVQCVPYECSQAGFAFRDGKVIHREECELSGGTSDPLRRLLKYMEVELTEEYFEPLRRGFFGQPKRIRD